MRYVSDMSNREYLSNMSDRNIFVMSICKWIMIFDIRVKQWGNANLMICEMSHVKYMNKRNMMITMSTMNPMNTMSRWSDREYVSDMSDTST